MGFPPSLVRPATATGFEWPARRAVPGLGARRARATGHGAADHGDRAVSGTRTGTTDGGAIHADQRLETVRLILVLCLDLTGQQRATLRLPHRLPGPVVDPALAKHPVPAGVPFSFTPALLGVLATTHWKALSRYFLGMA